MYPLHVVTLMSQRILTSIAPGIFDKTSKDPLHLLTTLLKGLHEDLIRDHTLDAAGQQQFNIPKVHDIWYIYTIRLVYSAIIGFFKPCRIS